ncbi:MAG: hypothetical protein JW863_09670 [Chitinispirillaceae bacterium]|nr:hypothetical protein [Chitinispirillaceae bacterium]
MNRRLFVALPVLLLMFCADRINPTNPYDPKYTGGDYTLSFHWDDNTSDTTLKPFQPYSFYCLTDSLSSFTFSIFPGDYTSDGTGSCDFGPSYTISFNGIGDFTFSIKARRPNGKDTSISFPLTVINPYVISVDSAALMRGDTVRCFVINTSGTFDRDTSLTIRWQRDTLPSFDVPFRNNSLVIPVHAWDTLIIRAQLLQNDIVRLHLGPDTIAVPEGTLPYVSIAEKFYVPLNQKFTIEVTDTSGGVDSLVWKGTSGLDTTTTGTTLTRLEWTWDITLTDTVTIAAKNRFGDTGNTVTTLIIPRSYRYSLLEKAFPTDVAARSWNSWTVEAYESDTLVTDSSIVFNWFTVPPSAADSIRANRGTFSMYFDDGVPLCSLGVVVVNTGNDTDSSWILKKKITVIAWRPVIRLTGTGDTTVNLNESVTFGFETYDTDSGGTVDSVFYLTTFGSTDPQLIGTGDTAVTVKFTEANTHFVSFWCIDNDGFSSDTVTVEIPVTADIPHFADSNSEVSVFTGETLRLEVNARPGNRESEITEYYWTFKQSGFTDTTTVNLYERVFHDLLIDTIEVRCRNSQDSVSHDPLKFFLRVSRGYPVVNSVTCDTRISFIGDSVDLAVTASDSNSTGLLTTCIIRANGRHDDTIAIDPPVKTWSNTLRIALNDTGPVLFSAVVIDNDALVSHPVTTDDSISVRLGRPYVRNMTPDTCWIFDDTIFSIDARDSNSSGHITGFYIQWESGSAQQSFTASQTIRHSYTSSGPKQLQIIATDNHGYSSNPFSHTIFIREGIPTVDSLLYATPVWINDTVLYTVRGTDENGSIEQYGVRWDGVGTFNPASPSGFEHTFNDTGTHTIEVFALDDDSYSSDTGSFTVRVELGQPEATLDVQSEAWINDQVTSTVGGSDENGTIESYALRWNTTDPFVTDETNVRTTQFNTDGSYTIEAYVLDDDGIPSAVVQKTLLVKRGDPSITGVSVDNTESDVALYIGDALTFTVTVSDPNNESEWVKVSWDGSQTFEDSVAVAANNTATFTRKFGSSQSGNHTARFRVVDADALTDDTSFAFTLLPGTPSVSLVSIGTPVGELFVNDDIEFEVHAEDANGSIRKIAVNWNGGTTVQDSIFYTGGISDVNTSFTHKYDTLGGSRTVNIWVIDEDTVMSPIIDTTITIRKGAPVLRGDTLDTLWVVVDNGAGFYRIHANASDINGTIKMYYWDDLQGWNDSSETDSSTAYQFRNVDMNNGIPFHIRVRDDDGFVRGDTLVVFADSAPPRPASFAYGISSDSTVLKWEKAVDVKDGIETQVQIYIKYGNTDEPDSALFQEPWPSLDDSRFGEETISGLGLHATYTFKPSTSGRWRVVLRDRRGTESVGPNTAGDPATFIAP